jgi:LysR family pca operon transcriptional activator
MPLDLRQLKRFVAVAEARSFNKAAEILAVSQPSLTRSIQLLEDSLDSKLLERGPRGIYLTAMGEELLPYAKIILNERDRAIASLNDLRNQKGETIAIGTDDAFAARRLPLALSRIFGTHPKLKIRVTQGDFPQMLNLVREGKLDMALGSRAPYLDLTGLLFEPLADEAASILMRAGHPLLQAGSPSREDLLTARWIVSDQPTIIEGWSDMFRRWGLLAPPVSLYTSSPQLIKQCLLNSDFVSVCNYTTYAEQIETGLLIPVALGQPMYSRPCGLFRRAETKLSRSARAFIDLLRVICEEDAPATA